MLKGIFIILLYLVLGEGLSYLIAGVIPGSVLGMILLFTSLILGIVKPEQVRGIVDTLTKNMAMFFVPASIGVMASWDLVSRNLLALSVMTIVSTILVIVVVAHIQQFSEKKSKTKKKADNN